MSTDRARFEAALDAARPALMQRAMTRLRNHAAAEDAVQETLLRALAKADWQGIDRPAHWLLGVLENYLLNEGRKYQPATGVGNLLETHGASLDPCADALDALATSEERTVQIAAIKDAMQRASVLPKEAAALIYRLSGLTNAEAAEKMQIEANAVRAYCSQAVAKIKPHLAAPLCAVPE